MGSYLSQPIFEPESSSGQGRGIAFGASSVQGWRASQEDAHNCIIDFDDDQNCSLFAVYDGHGGSEVSKYCSMHLPDFIKTLSSYKAGDYKQALIDAFVKFDETLTKPKTIEILKELAQYDSVDEGDDDEIQDETETLHREADIPIEEIIKKYVESQKETDAIRQKKAEAKAETNGDTNNGEHEEKDENENKEQVKTADEEKKKDPDGEKEKKTHSIEVKDNQNGKAEADKTEDKQPAGDSSSCASSTKNDVLQGGSSTARTKRAAAQIAEFIRKKDNGDANEGDDDEDDDEEDEESETASEESDEDDDDEDQDGIVEEDSEDDEEDDDDDDGSCDVLDSDIPGSGSGTTAVVALLKDNILTVANAGDSRAVVCRQGKAVDMSEDHKPEDYAERTRIERAGGKITFDGRVNGGLNLSRAIGDHVYKQNTKLPLVEQMISPLPDVKTLVIEPENDEFMVLACDGIWNCMTSQEVCNFVSACLKQGDSLSDICVQLFRRCIAPDTSGDGTGCDNMTCIVVQLSSKSSERKRESDTQDEEVANENKRLRADVPPNDE